MSLMEMFFWVMVEEYLIVRGSISKPIDKERSNPWPIYLIRSVSLLVFSMWDSQHLNKEKFIFWWHPKVLLNGMLNFLSWIYFFNRNNSVQNVGICLAICHWTSLFYFLFASFLFLFLSAIPFCWGVSTHELVWTIRKIPVLIVDVAAT